MALFAAWQCCLLDHSYYTFIFGFCLHFWVQWYYMLITQAGILGTTEGPPAACILPSPGAAVSSRLCPYSHLRSSPSHPPLFTPIHSHSDVSMCQPLRHIYVLCKESFDEL